MHSSVRPLSGSREPTPSTPPKLSPSTLPEAEDLEVSKVEEEGATGVTFKPE